MYFGEMPFNTSRLGFGIVAKNGTTSAQVVEQSVVIDVLRNVCTKIYPYLFVEAEQIVAVSFNHFLVLFYKCAQYRCTFSTSRPTDCTAAHGT